MVVHRIEPNICKECEARQLHPRFGEFLAYAERKRRDGETLMESIRKIVTDLAIDAYPNDPESFSSTMSLSRTTGYHIIAKRKAEREQERFVRDREATA